MLLQIENLSKNYQSGSRQVNALSAVDFSMEKGDFISLIGRSGSGKSTFANIIAGLLSADGGKLMFDGVDILQKDDDYLAEMRNDKLGYIPQQSALIASLTVLENVCLPFFLYPRSGDSFGRGMILLEKLGIKHLAKSYPRELSGGERKRVLIARAMINSPLLLIADEGTADLDLENTKEVMQILTDLNAEGTSILVITHELDTLDYAKQVYTMSEGQLTIGKNL